MNFFPGLISRSEMSLIIERGRKGKTDFLLIILLHMYHYLEIYASSVCKKGVYNQQIGLEVNCSYMARENRWENKGEGQIEA